MFINCYVAAKHLGISVSMSLRMYFIWKKQLVEETGEKCQLTRVNMPLKKKRITTSGVAEIYPSAGVRQNFPVL